MKAAKVNGGTAGGAAVVDCITAGGAVEVNCGAAGRQQGVSSDGSAVPASGSDSRSNIRSLIYQLVIGSQAYRRNRLVDYSHSGIVVVCSGSSTVPATGSFGWQRNASNGVVFVGVLARILVCP